MIGVDVGGTFTGMSVMSPSGGTMDRQSIDDAGRVFLWASCQFHWAWVSPMTAQVDEVFGSP